MRVPLVALIVLYAVGFFETSGNVRAASGYGIFKTDLLGFIDSKTDMSAKSISFSSFLPDINTSSGTAEGFSYLGLGVICLGFIAVVILIKSRFSGVKIFSPVSILFFATFLLMIFSLSNVFFMDNEFYKKIIDSRQLRKRTYTDNGKISTDCGSSGQIAKLQTNEFYPAIDIIKNLFLITYTS
jgi:hypothetical protein